MELSKTRSSRPENEEGAGDSMQRRIPSFKVLENDYATSKRLRSRGPSFTREPNFFPSVDSWGSGLEIGPDGERVGTQRMPFSIAGMWDSNPNSNLFGFTQTESEEDDEGEVVVQRLDDATLDDLALFDVSERRGGSDDGDDGGVSLPSSGPCEGDSRREFLLSIDGFKEVTRLNAHADRVPTIGTSCGRVDRSTCEHFGIRALHPTKQMRTFSMPMKMEVSHQREATEQTIHDTVGDLGRNKSNTVAVDSATAGSRVHDARGANIFSLPLNSIPDTTVPENHDYDRGAFFDADNAQDYFFLDLGPPGHDEGVGGFEIRNSGQPELMFAERMPNYTHRTMNRKKGEDKSLFNKVNRRENNKAGRREGTGTAGDAKSRKIRLEACELGGGVDSGKRQTSEDVAARLPLDFLECFYHMPLNVAAQQLHVSLTMLKKLCRAYGVNRWPHRQVSSLDRTIARLEDKISARSDGGKDAPSLVRKLQQAVKRRNVIIKTASAGLEVDVLNTIFTCRPGDIDEDLLLESTDVARAVGRIQHRGNRRCSDSVLEPEEERDEGDRGRPSAGQTCSVEQLPGRSGQRKSVRRFSVGKVQSSRPFSSSIRSSTEKQPASPAPPPAFDPGCSVKTFARPEATVESLSSRPSRKMKEGSVVASKGQKRPTTSLTRSDKGKALRVAAAGARATKAAAAAAGAGEAVATASSSETSRASNGSAPAEKTVVSVAPEPQPTCFTAALVDIGAPPGTFRPMLGYSNEFGMRSQRQSVAAMGEGGSVMPSLAGMGGTGCLKRVSAPETAGEAAAAKIEAGRPDTYSEVAERERTAMELDDWVMPQTPGPRSPLRVPRSGIATSHSLTITAAVDSVDTKLRFESPPPPLSIPPPHASLQWPQSRHTYLQQQFPRRHEHQSQQANNYHLNWFQGLYNVPLQQHPFTFPDNGVSPIETKAYIPAGHGRGDIIEGFSASPEPECRTVSDAFANELKTPICHTGGDKPVISSTRGYTGTSRPAPPSQSASVAATTATGGGTRRTGFMRFLMRQSTNSSFLSQNLDGRQLRGNAGR